MLLKKITLTAILLVAAAASAKNTGSRDTDKNYNQNYKVTMLCKNCLAAQALDTARLVPYNLIKTNIGVTLLLENLPENTPVIATYTDQGTLEIINYQSVENAYKLQGNLNNLVLMLNDQASVLIRI